MICARLLFVIFSLTVCCGQNKNLVRITGNDIRLNIVNTDTTNYTFGDTIRLSIRIKNITERKVTIVRNEKCFKLIEMVDSTYYGEKFSIEGISNASNSTYIFNPYEELIFDVSFVEFSSIIPSGKKKMGLVYYCEYNNDINQIKYVVASENSIHINILE